MLDREHVYHNTQVAETAPHILGIVTESQLNWARRGAAADAPPDRPLPAFTP